MRIFYFVLFGVFGAVFIGIAAANLRWYFEYLESRPFWRKLGNTGARILTGIVGALLILTGIAALAGWI